MENRFKSIPLSLLDLLAIFIPGTVWLVLLTTTMQLEINGESSYTPVNAWRSLITITDDAGSGFLTGLSLIVISMVIGYFFRPISTPMAQWFSKPFVGFHHKTRHLKSADRKFPYQKLFSEEPYYEALLTIIEKETDNPPESLPGAPVFAAAKRYLRLAAPALWEESERMEAESRMTGLCCSRRFIALSSVHLP